jgi:SpoVK/Ycf46/Vps4 family AAA+-type ATPase
MWIGWSADRLAKVFKEARTKQPSLIFIDELDAVCPPRGAYHDCISQEFTAQLLQEIDGLLSDTQAIFLVGATNRPGQVDSAILSRFSERIEIPLPDANTRAALLELFLAPLPFCGDRTRLIRLLALDSVGRSGRDLRGMVNQGVLSAVKRCSSRKPFRSPKPTSHPPIEEQTTMELRIWRRIYLCPFVRLNCYTKGFTVSFGHRGWFWLAIGRRGLRATLPTGYPGAYLTEGRTWDELGNRNGPAHSGQSQ